MNTLLIASSPELGSEVFPISNKGTKVFSYFHSGITHTQTPSKNLMLWDVYELIRKDSEIELMTLTLRAIQHGFDNIRATEIIERFKPIDSKLRAMTHEEILVMSPEDKGRAYKRNALSFCTFSGVFSRKEENGLMEHSGYICIDIDHLPGEALEPIFEELVNDGVLDTRLMFRSPSGNGIKMVIAIDPNKCSQKESYHGIANYLRCAHGLEADPSCCNVSTGCFLCHDENAMIKGESPLTFNPLNWQDEKEEEPQRERKNVYQYPSNERLENLVSQIESKGIDLTDNYLDWVKIGFALANELGEDGREYFHRISKQSTKYNSRECNIKYNECIRSNKGSVTISTLFYEAGLQGVDFKPMYNTSRVS